MSSNLLADAELEYALGNHDKARRMVGQALRQDWHNVKAWELLLDMADTEVERAKAEAGLEQARQQSEGGSIWDDDSPSASVPGEPAEAINLDFATLWSTPQHSPHSLTLRAVALLVLLGFMPPAAAILAAYYLYTNRIARENGVTFQGKTFFNIASGLSIVLGGGMVLLFVCALMLALIAGEV